MPLEINGICQNQSEISRNIMGSKEFNNFPLCVFAAPGIDRFNRLLGGMGEIKRSESGVIIGL